MLAFCSCYVQKLNRHQVRIPNFEFNLNFKKWAKDSNLSSVLGVSIGCSQTETCELSFFCSWLLLCFCLFGKPFEGEKAASRCCCCCCCDKCGAREPVSSFFFALSIPHTIPPNFSNSPEFPGYFPVSLTVSASSFHRLQEPKRCVREGRERNALWRYGMHVWESARYFYATPDVFHEYVPFSIRRDLRFLTHTLNLTNFCMATNKSSKLN